MFSLKKQPFFFRVSLVAHVYNTIIQVFFIKIVAWILKKKKAKRFYRLYSVSLCDSRCSLVPLHLK